MTRDNDPVRTYGGWRRSRSIGLLGLGPVATLVLLGGFAVLVLTAAFSLRALLYVGPERRDVMAARGHLARSTGEAGDPAAARDHYTALLPDMDRVLGPDHPLAVTARENLASWTKTAD